MAIFPNLRVPASGPRNARLAAIGMSPAKNEIADKTPFTGPSGRIFNDALLASKTARSQVYVTNLVNCFIDNNDLYSIPQEIMETERARVFRELDDVAPNCLLIMGGDTLDLLTASNLITRINKKTGLKYLATEGSKEGIQKWRGSIFQLKLPSGRMQKCVAAMHPASFIRGQWKWLPLYKYIDVPRAVTQSLSSEMELTPREAIVGPSFPQAIEWLNLMLNQEWVSIDYEGMAHITCLGSGNKKSAMCIPLNRVGSASYWTMEQEMIIWKLWCQLLESSTIKKIAQNASYEWIKSWLHGIYPNPLGCDTMHMHHCLYPDWGGITDEWTKRKRDIDNPGHGLALITSQYTDQPFYKDEGRHWRPEHGELAFWNYNALDVMVTYESAFKMMEELKSDHLWEVYQQEYLGGFEKLLQMEWFGTEIDVKRRAEARVELLQEMETHRQVLEDTWHMHVITKVEKKGQKPQAGTLNLASPAQVKNFFSNIKKYKLGVNRKTGLPKLDKEDLAALAIKHNDESITTMLRLREIQDLINDVIDQKLDPQNRIHTHFRQGGTNVTRLSSGESILGGGTNLQNLPREGVARSLFLP